MSFIKTQTIVNSQILSRLILRLSKELPKKSKRRFYHGVTAFSLSDYRSLNDAARQLSLRFNTGSSRVYRTLGDTSLANGLQSLLIKQALKGRTGRVYINIDHTTIGQFTVATAAIQNRYGRALPFWVQINKGTNNAASLPLFEALGELLAEIGNKLPQVQPYLVGDRWFGSQRLMELCQQNGCLFLFRSKVDKKVTAAWGKDIPLSEIYGNDLTVEYKRQDYRLVVSDLPADVKEQWFLLTNDHQTSRGRLISRYCRRWGIETTFKDIKHTQDLRLCRLRKISHLSQLATLC